jgi:hypothetical protein
LITFAGDKLFGLVNIVQRRLERNTTVDINGVAWSSIIPSISWTKCREGPFVVTTTKITVKRWAGQLEGNIGKYGNSSRMTWKK